MSLSEIELLANKILEKHFLCDSCLGRLFSKQLKLSSNRILGKKLKRHISKPNNCYVCKNLFDDLSPFLKLMQESSLDYEYSSFLIGAKIKPSIVDRDDYIRSKFKLQGIDGVKTALTHELAKKFSKTTKKFFDHLDPDVTFTLNLKEHICDLRSKQICLQGRYLKTARGFPQKEKPCGNCSGKGCRTCEFHGLSDYESVQGKISQILFQKFGGTVAKFTWMGGEDKSSLVLGTGRPFFVRMQNPKKRHVKFPKVLKKDSIEISEFKIIPDVPKNPLTFKSLISIKIKTKKPLTSRDLKKIKKSLQSPVVIYESSGRRSEKKIFNTKYKKTSQHSFDLIIDVEGGFPIKRFVTGDDVVPGVGEIIENECTCDEFDFLQIEMITNN